MATHYEMLGVAPGVTHEELRRAYYGLARRYHPDAHTQSAPAVQAAARRTMVAVNAAWAVLGDAERRCAYDAELAPRPRPSAPPKPPASSRQRTSRQRTRGHGFPEDFEANDWSEADEDVPAYLMEEDTDDGVRGLADIIVLVPVGLGALAVASFCLAVVMQWPALFGLSLLLVPLTLVTFLATPFAIIATKIGSRPTDD